MTTTPTTPTIDREFRSLIARLGADEYAQLEANLVAAGRARDPLVLWQGTLIDGHNRLDICQRRRLPFTTTSVDLPDRLAVRIWIQWNQLGRRNLTDDQRAMLAAGVAEDLARQSKRQQRSVAGKANAKRRNGGIASCPPLEKKIRASTAAAREARVSVRKVKQAQVLRKTDPKLAAKVKAGELSLANATREVVRAEVRERVEGVVALEAKASAGVYDVVVVDPPWPTEKIARDERPQQAGLDYPTMTLDQIRDLVLPVADAAHVWLWTPHRFLPDAILLLEAWQLRYVCAFVWHKPGGFQPLGLPQLNCEFALYARRGSPPFLETTAFPVCFDAPRREHSAKPDHFYDVVRRVTGGRRLDMFNRRKIEGFDGWGKEAVA